MLWKSAYSHSHNKGSSPSSNGYRCDALYLRLMYLLQNTRSKPERTDMLLDAATSPALTGGTAAAAVEVQVLVAILTTLVKYDPTAPLYRDAVVARCHHLLRSIGEIPLGVIEACCHRAIDVLAGEMERYSSTVDGGCTDEGVERGVIVLGYLVGLFCDRTGVKIVVPIDVDNVPPSDEKVDQAAVKEGDVLWYVNDGGKADSTRVQATVTEVHTDDLPHLYFTIRLDNDNDAGKESKVVRQTVAARLRTRPLPPTPTLTAPLPARATDKSVRRLEEAMVSRLVLPYLAGEGVIAEAAAEVTNVVISRCGLGGSKRGTGGIGTVRYDVFLALTKLGQVCRGDQAVSNGMTDKTKGTEGTEKTKDDGGCLSSPSLLVNLSLALGYGRLTQRGKDNRAVIGFDCTTLTKAILQSWEEGDDGFHYRAVLMWLSVSMGGAMDGDNVAEIWSLLDGVTKLVGAGTYKGYDPSMWLIRSLAAFESVRVRAAAIDVDGDNRATYIASEQEAVSNLLGVFVRCVEPGYDTNDAIVGSHFTATSSSSDSTPPPTIHNEPPWSSPFRSFILHGTQSSSSPLAYAVEAHAESLSTALSSPTPARRWCAFQLLAFRARTGRELYPEDDVLPPHGTCERLHEVWKQGLAEREAAELEEDVLVAARWLPHRLMERIESWSDEDDNIRTGDNEAEDEGKEADRTDEEVATIMFLRWLLCLDFLDAAATSDMRNRSHLGSYLQRTSAVPRILDAALGYTTLDDQRCRGEWSTCTSLPSTTVTTSNPPALAQIATLAVFRTVESVPTLCKSWWSDDCPRSSRAGVARFVEGAVAPETLRRELERIDGTGGLGDLVVSGSCVSREVTATYVQDECKLSVLITIPPSFPLRNVQVDCQKTLGIDAKRWRHWSLQIMRMLNGQDGSVLDALLLWKQNVDKEFEGVEPCPVCYSVLCVKTHSMPNLECRTCANRFHSSCLYKWFSSSGKNSCVLCQQPWSGTKVL